MSDTLKQWEGQVVDGKFPLLRHLGGSGLSAVFLTERRTGERTAKAAIKLIPSVEENDESQLAQWRLATELSHPHLLATYEMGRCELGEAALLYVVTEFADENLAEVLSARALTPAEAREMLTPVLEALGYLHGRGLVHGHIKPANIMADGDHLKLSSDTLCRAGALRGLPHAPDTYDPPESSRGIIPMTTTASPAADVWSLGVTIVEALTQHVPTAPAEQGEVLLPELPEPFLDIARHCLIRHPQGRWTVANITARLQGRVVAGPQVRPAAVQKPARPSRPAVRSQQRPHPRARRRGFAVPVLVVLAIVAILAGPRLLRRAPQAPEATAPTSEPAAPLAPERQAEATPAIVPVPPAPTTAGKSVQDQTGAPVTASLRPEILRQENAGAGGNAVANAPGAAVVPGEVLARVLPNVSQSAQDSIQGTVRVNVKVDVDSSGSVERAELAAPGPSRYFARIALEAAQRWKFRAPSVAGRSAMSSWNLRFDFTRDGTTVVPAQDTP